MISPGITPFSDPEIAPHRSSAPPTSRSASSNQSHIQADRKWSAAGDKIQKYPQEAKGCRKMGWKRHLTAFWTRNWTPKSLPNLKLPFSAPRDFLTVFLWCTSCSGSRRGGGGSSPSTSWDGADVLMDACRQRSYWTCGWLLKDEFSKPNYHPATLSSCTRWCTLSQRWIQLPWPCTLVFFSCLLTRTQTHLRAHTH